MTEQPPNFSMDLSGQVALVTGASAGLGRHFAKVLAAAGAKVAVTARRMEKLAELCDEIRAEGGTAAPFRVDVTDAAQLLDVVGQAEAELGPVTILVNNAGIPDAQYATKLSLEMIDNVIATNLRGPYVLSCEVARRLIRHRLPGRIVNIASMAAFEYNGNGASLYSTTKAGVIRMTEALAVEWAKFHINVNAIAPGTFRSEMLEGMFERTGDISAHYPRKRVGEPSQIDSTLLFLVSPSSDFVTGTFVKIDDGQHLR